MKLFKKTVVARPGCPPLMIRWIVLDCPLFSVRVHKFLRSDPDDMHDHPWSFVSIMLRGGYWEREEDGRRWRRRGSIVFRRAMHVHRVELDEGKTALTLCITGRTFREWGFHLPGGEWVFWRHFFNRKTARGDCPGMAKRTMFASVGRSRRVKLIEDVDDDACCIDGFIRLAQDWLVQDDRAAALAIEWVDEGGPSRLRQWFDEDPAKAVVILIDEVMNKVWPGRPGTPVDGVDWKT